MLELNNKIILDDETILSPNLCDRFTAEDLVKIGGVVLEGYQRDKRSREKWERRSQAAMNLAMQVQKDKAFPWQGASNVAFPLITIGALNFAVRAYPALISGLSPVKCRVNGPDPKGEKTRRAARIASHMSWQVLEEQQEWEEQKDRLLINLPIVGTVFVKSYWDADKNRKCDETVLAQDLVVDYWAKSIESCPRKTHVIPFFRNQIHSGIKREVYRDVTGESWYGQPPANAPQGDQNQGQKDNRTGMSPPATDDTTPYVFLEQHVDMDLDQDGYAEPYIITIEETSQSVIRIVTGFDRPEDVLRNKNKEIISIRRTEYFTKYSFIPSPDGGIYDVGFGVLLGPLNEATNSLINQMIDAGTMRNTAGGFLGRGAKIRGGTVTFAPFQWHRVDSNGDDLRKSLVQLPTNEPSAVLFNLLTLLINYVERLSGTTDPSMGENPGQNTPAETSRNMIVEGQRIYSAIYKRVWRSMKEEFKKDFVLNGIYLPARRSFGSGQMAMREDYLGNPDDIAPAADPNIVSDQMALNQALMLREFAQTTPGYNRDLVEQRVLSLMKVDAVEQIYPGIEATGAPKDVKLQIQESKAQVDMAWLEVEKTKFAASLMEEVRFNDAQIMKIGAEIEDMRATTAGDEGDRQIGFLNAMLGAFKAKNDLKMSQLDVLIKSLEVKREQVASGDRGNVRRLAPASGDGSGKRSSSSQAA